MNRLLLISFLIFITACSKEQVISVKAVHMSSGQPISNFEYYVLSSHEVKGETVSETVAYGKTDFQGNGIINLKMKRSRTYTLHGVKPENACYLDSDKFSLTKSDSDLNFQFEIGSCGTVKLDIDNIGCTGPNDEMRYRIKPAFESWRPWSSAYSGCYSGLPKNLSVSTGPLKIQWNVIKTGYSYADSAEININQYAPTNFHLQY